MIGVCVAGLALVVGSIIGRSALFAAPYNAQTSAKYKSKLTSLQKELVKLSTAKTPDAKKIAAQQALITKLESDSHWHSAYGIYNCDGYVGTVTTAADGTKSVKGSIDATAFPDTLGIHAHDDGLIHIHPFLDRAAGKKARLGLFMDAVKLTISKNKIVFPADGTGVKMTTLDVGKTKCKAKKAEISVLFWKSATDTAPVRYTSDFRSIPLRENSAYAIVFAPVGTKVSIPGSIATLEKPADVAATSATTTDSAASTTLVPINAGTNTIVVGGTTTVPGAGVSTTVIRGEAKTTGVGATTIVPGAGVSTTVVTATTSTAPTTVGVSTTSASPTTVASTTSASPTTISVTTTAKK